MPDDKGRPDDYHIRIHTKPRMRKNGKYTSDINFARALKKWYDDNPDIEPTKRDRTYLKQLKSFMRKEDAREKLDAAETAPGLAINLPNLEPDDVEAAAIGLTRWLIARLANMVRENQEATDAGKPAPHSLKDKLSFEGFRAAREVSRQFQANKSAQMEAQLKLIVDVEKARQMQRIADGLAIDAEEGPQPGDTVIVEVEGFEPRRADKAEDGEAA